MSRLEEKNLIISVPHNEDKRFKQLRLTPESVRLYQEMQNKIDQISEIILDGISHSQQDILSLLFQKMIQNLSG